MMAGQDFVAGKRSEVSNNYMDAQGLKMSNTRSAKNISSLAFAF